MGLSFKNQVAGVMSLEECALSQATLLPARYERNSSSLDTALAPMGPSQTHVAKAPKYGTPWNIRLKQILPPLSCSLRYSDQI